MSDESDSLGRSKEETSLWGTRRVVHRDTQGNLVGTSKEATDWLGRTVVENRDAQGQILGTSRERTDLLGRDYLEHRDGDGKIVGTSKSRKTAFGSEVIEHFDEDGDVIAHSTASRNLLGQRVTDTFRGKAGDGAGTVLLVLLAIALIAILAPFVIYGAIAWAWVTVSAVQSWRILGAHKMARWESGQWAAQVPEAQDLSAKATVASGLLAIRRPLLRVYGVGLAALVGISFIEFVSLAGPADIEASSVVLGLVGWRFKHNEALTAWTVATVGLVVIAGAIAVAWRRYAALGVAPSSCPDRRLASYADMSASDVMTVLETADAQVAAWVLAAERATAGRALVLAAAEYRLANPLVPSEAGDTSGPAVVAASTGATAGMREEGASVAGSTTQDAAEDGEDHPAPEQFQCSSADQTVGRADGGMAAQEAHVVLQGLVETNGDTPGGASSPNPAEGQEPLADSPQGEPATSRAEDSSANAAAVPPTTDGATDGQLGSVPGDAALNAPLPVAPERKPWRTAVIVLGLLLFAALAWAVVDWAVAPSDKQSPTSQVLGSQAPPEVPNAGDAAVTSKAEALSTPVAGYQGTGASAQKKDGKEEASQAGTGHGESGGGNRIAAVPPPSPPVRNAPADNDAAAKEPRSGLHATFWPGSTKKQRECTYKEDREEGLCTEWAEDGTRTAMCSYARGLLSGPCLRYDATGRKTQNCSYVDGRRSGPCWLLSKDGQFSMEGAYTSDAKSSRRDGRWMAYFVSGKLRAEGSYGPAAASPEVRAKWPVDGLVHLAPFSEDLADDVGNAVKVGTWKYYLEGGALEAEVEYASSGDVAEKRWLPDGKPSLRLTYTYRPCVGLDSHGQCTVPGGPVLTGEYFAAHSNGQPAEEGSYKTTYKIGQKVGTWKVWHPNGQIAAIHRYESPLEEAGKQHSNWDTQTFAGVAPEPRDSIPERIMGQRELSWVGVGNGAEGSYDSPCKDTLLRGDFCTLNAEGVGCPVELAYYYTVGGKFERAECAVGRIDKVECLRPEVTARAAELRYGSSHLRRVLWTAWSEADARSRRCFGIVLDQQQDAGQSTDSTPREPNTPPGGNDSQGSPNGQIRAMLSTWADAQTKGDFAGYSAFYPASFYGVKRTAGGAKTLFDRFTWLDDRRKMFTASQIVKVDGATVESVVAGSTATVTFTQYWKSPTYADKGVKKMTLYQSGSGWKILSEEMVSSEKWDGKSLP